MKLEQLKKIYTEQVAQYINDGWTIDPFIHDPQCETTVVFVRGNVRHVVYMRIQHKAEHMYEESVTVGSASSWEASTKSHPPRLAGLRTSWSARSRGTETRRSTASSAFGSRAGRTAPGTTNRPSASR